MPSVIHFEAVVEKVAGEGGWHIIRLPRDVVSSLGEASGKNGNVPVMVTVGKTEFPTTTMSMGSQQWFVAVKAQVRKAESIAEGDHVQVKLVPDASRL